MLKGEPRLLKNGDSQLDIQYMEINENQNPLGSKIPKHRGDYAGCFYIWTSSSAKLANIHISQIVPPPPHWPLLRYLSKGRGGSVDGCCCCCCC